MDKSGNLSRTVALVRRHCLSAFAHGCPIFLSPKENKPNGYVSNDWSPARTRCGTEVSTMIFVWSCMSSSHLWKSQVLHLEEYQMSAALMDLLVTSPGNIKWDTATFLTFVDINYIHHVRNYISYPPCLVTSAKFPGFKGDVYRSLENFNNPFTITSKYSRKAFHLEGLRDLKITKQPQRPHLWAFSAGCASVPETWGFQQLLDSYNSYWSTGLWHRLVKLDPFRGRWNNIMQYHD